MSNVDQAAVLLMSLGEREAAQVLKHLGPKEVQRIGMAMSQLETVQQEQVESAVDNFLEEADSLTGLGVGSDKYIRTMLFEALGEEKAKTVVDRVLENTNTKGLETLKWMDARSIAALIDNEHPQIQAIVLSYIDGDQAAEILGLLPEKNRLDIITRISELETVQPEALQELDMILEKQFSGGKSASAAAMGGLKAAADIMNNMDSGISNELMEAINETDEDLGIKIQDLMFIFDNLKDTDDRGIQALLREVSSEVLILALKGADDELKEKIFGNMSKRAAELLRDDLEASGPVKLSEVEGAQREILIIARRMADAGEIMLGGSGGEEML